MDNDRVHRLDGGTGGTGLLGLGERLAGLGGSIATQYPGGGHFRLEARLPGCRPVRASAAPVSARKGRAR